MKVATTACVCYTRSMVQHGDERRAVRRVALSAYSVRVSSPSTSIWLITDGNPEVMRASAWALLSSSMQARVVSLFDQVEALNQTAFEPLRAHNESTAARVAQARIAKIRVLAAPPCATTLFLDDDTYACDGPDLHLVVGPPDVRLFLFYKTDREHAIAAAARSCGKTLDDVADCYDRAGAFIPANCCAGGQSGAILVRRSQRAARFASDWLDAYVTRDNNDYANPDSANWLDQTALRALSLKACGSSPWTLGHLPYGLNFRGVKKMAFVGHVKIIHQKALFPPSHVSLDDQARHLDRVCRRLNNDTGLRNPTIFDTLRDFVTVPLDDLRTPSQNEHRGKRPRDVSRRRRPPRASIS